MSVRPGTLLNGELIEHQIDDLQNEYEATDAEINRRYETGEIRIVTEQARYPLSTVPALVKSDNYILNPEFQRRHRWSTIQKSRLIESFIMNVPIPPVFLYETDYSRFEVMDGLQRLTAITEFYENRFSLEDLEEWGDLNGRTYKTLPRQLQRGIDRRYLSSIILLQETAKSEFEAQRLKQIVFERINSGGVSLSPQESRNAIYDGPLNKLCIRLARNPFFCEAWDIPGPEYDDEELMNNELFRTMQDVELVLRFFAGRQRVLRRDQKNFKLFLDFYLKTGNTFPRDVLSGLDDIFSRTIKLVFGIFEERAFWLYRNRNERWNWLKRPTTAVFDPLMFVFSQYLDRSEELLSKREQLVELMPGFYRHFYDRFEGRNTNPSTILAREDAYVDLINAVL